MDTDDKSLPPGATRVPGAGVNYPNHDQAATTGEVKRDAAAAGRLPELYKALAEAKARLEDINTSGGKIDTHTVSFNLNGVDRVYHPADREAFNELIRKDLQAAVDKAAGEIKALGFEA